MSVFTRPVGMALALLLTPLFLLPAGAGTRLCDDNAAQLVADVYLQSIPVFADAGIEPMVAANRKSLTSGGAGLICMKKALAALRDGTLSLPAEVPETAPSGMPDLSAMPQMGGMPAMMGKMGGAGGPGGMKSKAVGESGDAILIDHLNWLISTLPAASGGDFGPYQQNKPQMVQMADQQVGMMKGMCQFNPGMCSMMKQRMQAERPQIRTEIYNTLTGRTP